MAPFTDSPLRQPLPAFSPPSFPEPLRGFLSLGVLLPSCPAVPPAPLSCASEAGCQGLSPVAALISQACPCSQHTAHLLANGRTSPFLAMGSQQPGKDLLQWVLSNVPSQVPRLPPSLLGL